MVVENENIRSIYDLFAMCCAKALEYCEEKELIPPSHDEEYENIQGAVATYMCDKDFEGRKRALSTLLSDLVDIVGIECTSEQAFKIALCIDENVHIEEPVSEDAFSSFVTYSSLNQYLCNEVRIFPMLESTFASKLSRLYSEKDSRGYELFRKNKPTPTSAISAYFKNYIIMDKGNINIHPLKIVRVKQNSELCQRLSEKGTITFDLVPMTQVNIEQIGNMKYDDTYFWMEGMRQEQEARLLEKQKNYFENPNRKQADFVVFPEMLFTDALLENSKKRAKYDEIVVNGSIWKEFKNKSIVSMGQNKVMEHYKRYPFEYKKDGKVYIERLALLERSLKDFWILESEGFGRVAVGICRDLDNEATRSLWETMHTNILIIPAYTPSHDMEQSARSMASLHNMIVVLNNACAALSKLTSEQPGNGLQERIGFVALPGKNKKDRISYVEYYQKGDKCANCEKVCVGHHLEIDLKHTAKRKNVLTYATRWE